MSSEGSPRQPIWTRPEPGARRPSLTRDAIAVAALQIADEEGFEALSMRRVATRLGVGTMSLYHYIRTKDDLLALMDDRLMAEVLIPDEEMPAGWRDGLAELARRSCAAWLRHPWTLIHLAGARVGPNGMRHMEQSLAAITELGLPPAQQLELITLVDDYVIGYVMREQELVGMQRDGSEVEELELMSGYMAEQMATGEYPHLRAFVGADEHDMVGAWQRIAAEAFGSERFERGLARLLDGIALDLERR